MSRSFQKLPEAPKLNSILGSNRPIELPFATFHYVFSTFYYLFTTHHTFSHFFTLFIFSHSMHCFVLPLEPPVGSLVSGFVFGVALSTLATIFACTTGHVYASRL